MGQGWKSVHRRLRSRIQSYHFYGQLFGGRSRDLCDFLHVLVHPELHDLFQGEAFRLLIKLPLDFIFDLVPVPAAQNRKSDREASSRVY